MNFSVLQEDRETSARLGRLSTAHGAIDTPAFMPVGTLGTVKGIDPADLEQLGFGLMLNNAYTSICGLGIRSWLRWADYIASPDGPERS